VLECAKHNAAVYGVKNKIVWISGDCFEVLRKRLKSMGSKAVVFGSPPWGGEFCFFSLMFFRFFGFDISFWL